ncbi:MAG: APC family permease, partial [Hyphococcus sp.]
MSDSGPGGADVSLKRAVSKPLLVLYGLGTMLGAGIYALIGEVAGVAGALAPLAFVLAAAIAALTAASYAEFSSRYPASAGEAAYVSAGFANRRLPLIVGLLIVMSGVVSSGVMFRSFIGYAQLYLAFPDVAGVLCLTLVIGGLAAWGIGQSLAVAAVVTLIEGAALVLIVALGAGAEPAATAGPAAAIPRESVNGVIFAAILAFYAFIGFEDMVNIAEEVKRPRRTIPGAILIALAATTLLYAAVSWVAVRAVPIAELAASSAPMTLVFARLSDWPAHWVSAVAMLAVTNGALVQVIMASRVLYGLGRQRL